MDSQSHIILPRQTSLYQTLDGLASEASVVCVSGLPAVGKSLYVQQFSYMALAKGRQITTIQWDLARQAFETEEVLSKYPEVEGITHAGIRKACGIWARKAVLDWYHQNTANDILIVESPLIGSRLIELATPLGDEAENFLSSPAVQFVVPVPTAEVRTAIRARRRKTAGAPGHEQEKADASPQVIMELYKELGEVAVKLGYDQPLDWYEYKPEVYEFVYRKVLKNRNMVVLNIDMVLEAQDSVYTFRKPGKKNLVPLPGEIMHYIQLMERQFRTTGELQTSVDEWYLG